jgi:hypothetical protein
MAKRALADEVVTDTPSNSDSQRSIQSDLASPEKRFKRLEIVETPAQVAAIEAEPGVELKSCKDRKGSTASDHDQGLGALQDVSTGRFMGLDAGAEQLSEWLQLDDDLEDYMVDVVGDQVTAKVRGLMVEVVGCDELHEDLLEECYKVLKNAVSKPLQQATDVLSSLDDIKNTFKISLQNVLDQHGGLVRRPK